MDNNFAIGTRVYYTGDMANQSGTGIISEHYPADRWTNGSFDITEVDGPLSGGRTWRRIQPSHFAKGPGVRFWLESEWHAKRSGEIRQLKAELEALAARRAQAVQA